MSVVVGVVLAGGLARRMGGGDKGEKRIGGAPMLQRVLDRLAPQVSALAINANGDPSRFAGFGAPVIADAAPDHPGPLAGVLAAMDWARGLDPRPDWIVTAPVDAPFLPLDLVDRLQSAARENGTPLAVAASGERTHPVVGLWSPALRDDLAGALIDEGLRKIDRWTARHGCAVAAWTLEPIDPFFNVNTPGDLA
ncbi:MAG: molybdenum cofactor guanylyltransferase MobA, partial [Pseudomonadota bacterium]